jgi:hypothetical protein
MFFTGEGVMTSKDDSETVDSEWAALLSLAERELSPTDFAEVSGWVSQLRDGSMAPAGDVPPVLISEEENKEEASSSVPSSPTQLEKKSTDVRGMLANMTMAQKLKIAMSGNGIVRRLLIQDPSRLVQECVLNNPKIGLNEVEAFAKNTNVDAQVLRSISGRPTWMRTYRVKVNLVTNPKCPPDLSMKWLKFLHDNELKLISKSKNIPQVLQVAAKKKLSDKG